MFLSILSCLLTQVLVRRLRWNSVKASASVTLLFYGMFMFLESSYYIDTSNYLKVVFGASFAGMTKVEISWISTSFIIGVLFWLFFTWVFPYLPYQGGALGFSAFLSVLTYKKLSILLS